MHAVPLVGHEQPAFIAFRIPCLVSNFAISSCCSPWFIPRPADTLACSLQLSLQRFRRFRTFCCFACVTIHVLIRSSYGRRCIKADVQNSTQPCSLTPLAICTGTSGLHSQSATQLPSVAFTSLSRWFVRMHHDLIATNRF